MDFLERDSLNLSDRKMGLDSGIEAEKALLYGAIGSSSEPKPKAPADGRENNGKNEDFKKHVGGGRPKGQQNRLTRTMKEAIEKAFDNVGGPAYLEKMANGTATDRQAFMALIGRLLPMQVNSNIDQRIRIELPWLASRGIGKVQAGEAEALALVGKGRTIEHAEQGGDDERENT